MGEEVTETTPIVNSENDQATEDNNSAETWGQWFATKLSLPPGSFRDALTDPNLSDKLKDQAKEIKDKVKEGVTNTYNKVDDFSNRLKEKFAEKYPETAAGLKNFSDQISGGIIVGYEKTSEGYHKFREDVSEAWTTNYNNTSESFTR